MVWLRHGHVFANAMTGNLVLLAVSLTGRDMAQALRHVAPLLAFVLGVSLGKYVLQYHSASALRLALWIEMAGLAIAGALSPHVSSHLTVGLVALTAAMQITAFRRLGHVAYNTTFVTGNLRAVFDGAFDILFPAEPRRETRQKGWRIFRDLGLISLGFLLGAILGATCAPRLADRSFWLADLLLLAAGLLLRKSLTASPAAV